MKQFKDVILRDKPVKIFLNITRDNKTYGSMLAKKSDVTYSHLVNLIKKMIVAKLVKKVIVGRTSYIILTEKGRDLQDALSKLMEELK
jgi:DNA-binding MarR family transcriptional regulator